MTKIPTVIKSAGDGSGKTTVAFEGIPSGAVYCGKVTKTAKGLVNAAVFPPTRAIEDKAERGARRLAPAERDATGEEAQLRKQ